MLRRTLRPLRFRCPCCGQRMAISVQDSPCGSSRGSSTGSSSVGHSDTDSCSLMDLHELDGPPVVVLQPVPSEGVDREMQELCFSMYLFSVVFFCSFDLAAAHRSLVLVRIVFVSGLAQLNRSPLVMFFCKSL